MEVANTGRLTSVMALFVIRAMKSAKSSTLILINFLIVYLFNYANCRSQWPSGLRRISTADRLLGLPI
jgi:hypothetical protein